MSSGLKPRKMLTTILNSKDQDKEATSQLNRVKIIKGLIR